MTLLILKHLGHCKNTHGFNKQAFRLIQRKMKLEYIITTVQLCLLYFPLQPNTSAMDPGISTHSVSDMPYNLKKWTRYISLATNMILDKLPASDSLVTYVYHLQAVQSSKRFCPHVKLTSYLAVHGPCYSVYLSTWMPSSHYWKIWTHGIFMINITILHAYTPYTDHCHPHGVSLQEKISTTEKSTFGKVCGLVNMETFYSKTNAVLLRIYFEQYSLHRSVDLDAVYQVHMKGLAYKTTGNILMQAWLKVNLKPHYRINIRQYVHYVWYFAQEFLYGELQPQMSSISLNLKSFICNIRSSKIYVYAGLVTEYWMQLMVPFHVFDCNTTQHNIVVLDFHVYATVVLSTVLGCEYTSAEINFTYIKPTNISKLNTPERLPYMSTTLPKHHHIHSAFINSALTVFWFYKMHYHGNITTSHVTSHSHRPVHITNIQYPVGKYSLRYIVKSNQCKYCFNTVLC